MQHWKFSGTRRGEHVEVHVRAGEQDVHRPLLGTLFMTPAQWVEFAAILGPAGDAMPVTGSIEVEQMGLILTAGEAPQNRSE